MIFTMNNDTTLAYDMEQGSSSVSKHSHYSLPLHCHHHQETSKTLPQKEASSSSPTAEKEIVPSSLILQDNNCNNDGRQRHVRFCSELEVHTFEKSDNRTACSLWYGCHELQKMIDEFRLFKEDEREENNDVIRDCNDSKKQVRFCSEIENEVYTFEKFDNQTACLLWYGCHELQKMLDESRCLGEKEEDSDVYRYIGQLPYEY